MRTLMVAAALASVAGPLYAQQPDSVRARQIRDSIALVRELEAMRSDTTRAVMSPQQGPVNPRMLPDISAVGDFVGDFSPRGSTQEDGTRLGVREVELALQAVVDPYFRGDVFLGFSDAEGVHIEQAFLTTTSLPGFELRAGRFLMPVSKVNTTHRHDLHSVEYPWVVQRFLGAEGLKGTGLSLSRIFSPFGFYQELILTAVDRVGETPEGLVTPEPVNKELDGIGFSARLRNYWDLSESANVELSASALTGKVEQPCSDCTVPPDPSITAVAARQALVGADLTFRWRPLQQGLYQSFIAQAEFLLQSNEFDSDPNYSGTKTSFNGAYGFARWQLSRRWYIAGRYDWVEDPFLLGVCNPQICGETLTAASGYIQWFPSEFSKFTAAFERLMPSSVTGIEATNRILLQASFAIGPHKPHPF